MEEGNQDAQKSLVYLTEVETVAQDLLTAREQKLDYSNARNKCNEALRCLEKSDCRTGYISLGTCYMEFPRNALLEVLKTDIRTLTEEIDALHQDVKNKAGKLRDLEHQPGIVGVGLKPLTGAEARAVRKAFGD